MLFGNRTEELSDSFVGLKKTNTEKQTQESGDGKPQDVRKPKETNRDLEFTRTSSAYRASSHSLPNISKDEFAFLGRTGFSEVK